MWAIIDEELDKMLKEGVVRPSSSPWISPILITRRKDGKSKFCIDFRKLTFRSTRGGLPKIAHAHWRPNPEKCKFFRAELKYLGHIVDQDGLRTDPSKVAAIKYLTPTRNLKEARRFLGLVSCYRRFIKDVTHIAAPLHRLVRKRVK